MRVSHPLGVARRPHPGGSETRAIAPRLTSSFRGGYFAPAVNYTLLRTIFAASALLVVAVGCGDDAKITVYRIPKETKPEATSQRGDNAANVHWTAPAGWEEQPATGFRKGSFLVRGEDGKQADVSVVSFPESAGGLLANINRWRDQLKLAPVADPQQAGATLAIGKQEFFFVDLTSEQPLLEGGSKSRILGGILPLNGETWFFKMSGPDQLVEAQRDLFRQFLGSVHLAAATPLSTNSGASTNPPTPPPVEAPQEMPIQYALPPGWQEKPLSSMRLASFRANVPNGKEADISVVSLAGMAGGDLANVNRWRGQVNLGPIDESALQQSVQHLQANGHDFLVVDLVSDAPMGDRHEKQRIVAAILDENDRSWFIKMTGEDEAVASQKSAFTDFLRSLKIP